MTSPLAEAAAKIRADIRAAGAEQDLPPYPPQAVITVRALTTAIVIEAGNVPHSWLVQEGTQARLSVAALALKSALLQIARRHFEADGRTSFLDVQFRAEGEEWL